MATLRRTLAIAVLLASVEASAETVAILDDADAAFRARAGVIRSATARIDVMYFMARDDRVALGVLAMLREAKRRGVPDVRVLLDGSFHRIPKAVLAHLRDEGIEVRVYHPLDLRRPSWMLRRMHEKLIVADAARYVAGGRNLAVSYFDMDAKQNYVDRDVRVDGASAGVAARHFDAVWASEHVSPLRVRVKRREKEQAAERLAGILAGLERDGLLETDDTVQHSTAPDAVRFLHDPVNSGSGPRVSASLGEILEGAHESIVIESPYFIPSRSVRRLLDRKLAAGVSVLVLTNSLRSTDGLLPQAAYLKYRRGLVRAGVDVYEYKGPDVLHAKSIVVDGRVAMIGSYNIDPRSQFLNTEVMCVVEDEAVARELRASIGRHMENAWAITQRARGPRVSRATSLRLWAARLLLPLIERQL